MTIKLQSSLSSSDGVQSCLIYNKNKRIFYETSKPEEVSQLMVILKKRDKAYFKGVLVKRGKDKNAVTLGEEVPAEDW